MLCGVWGAHQHYSLARPAHKRNPRIRGFGVRPPAWVGLLGQPQGPFEAPAPL